MSDAVPVAGVADRASNRCVRTSFDPAKSERHARLRGLPFDPVRDLDFGDARFAVDDRKDDPEIRIVAVGVVGERLQVLCLTETPDGIRVISLRKANRRETQRCAQARTDDPS